MTVPHTSPVGKNLQDLWPCHDTVIQESSDFSQITGLALSFIYFKVDVFFIKYVYFINPFLFLNNKVLIEKINFLEGTQRILEVDGKTDKAVC